MPSKQSKFRASVQVALRSEPSVWTPQCPEPETLLDWIEQDNAYPDAAILLDHIGSCAYCRREYVALQETWNLARRPVLDLAASVAARPAMQGIPRKVAAWRDQLLQEGFTSPMRAVQAALERIDRAVALAMPEPVRSLHSPSNLRPAFTAIRSLHPHLTWTAAEGTNTYLVMVFQSQGRQGLRQVWRGSVGQQTRFTLPEEAELEPGKVYLWQVIALHEHVESPAAPVGFATVTEPQRDSVEALEQEVGDMPLALASLYEAHGLYEEALEQIEKAIPLDTAPETVRTLQERLLAQLHLADSVSE